MDWKPAIDEERAALKRIAVLLLALADRAVLAGSRTGAVRTLVLWLLLAAEAAARSLVTAAPAPCPFHHAGTSRADAMRLARRLRNLAREVERQAASVVCHDGIGHAEPAWGNLCRTPQLAGAPTLVALVAFPAPLRDALPVAGFPDTS